MQVFQCKSYNQILKIFRGYFRGFQEKDFYKSFCPFIQKSLNIRFNRSQNISITLVLNGLVICQTEGSIASKFLKQGDIDIRFNLLYLFHICSVFIFIPYFQCFHINFIFVMFSCLFHICNVSNIPSHKKTLKFNFLLVFKFRFN